MSKASQYVAAEWMRRYDEMKAQRDQLREALCQIERIEDKMEGGDWDEIEEARSIARAALAETEENDK